MDKRFTAVSDCANCAERYMRSHLHPFMCWIQKSWCDSRWKTAWWFLGWPRPITIQKLQVRLHSNLDGSSLAHAIQVPMGPLRDLEVLHLFRWFTHTLLRFTRRIFYIQTLLLLHTNALTHRRIYTETLLHTDAFTHGNVYAAVFTHGRFCRQTLLHTDAFAHRRFCTQRHLLHTDACTQMPFPHKHLRHTDALTQQSLHKVLPSTTSHYTACWRGTRGQEGGERGARRGCERWLREAPSTSTTFTSKLARSTSQYYFVPQSLQNVFSSTTYFVLQSLDKALPSTTLYACTKYFALQSLHKVLCTTKLAQCTSQCYFVLLTQSTSQYVVLQSLHIMFPSTTSYCKAWREQYYKACTKYFPLCTTKLQKVTVYFILITSPYFSYYKACRENYHVVLANLSPAYS